MSKGITKTDLQDFKQEIIREIKKSTGTNLIEEFTKNNRWVKAKTLIFMLGVTKDTLRNWSVKGIIRVSKIDGTLFYDLNSVKKVLEENASIIEQNPNS
ncbi:MAG: hypothetical protein LAT51_13640 [Flavobacteriaceae bacterium]|nr:hypothetical protein [Flavobacteriaceae bacterium]